MRPELLKLLEENTGKKLFDIGLSKNFGGYGTRNVSNKTKDKQIELKSFSAAKESISKIQRQPKE